MAVAQHLFVAAMPLGEGLPNGLLGVRIHRGEDLTVLAGYDLRGDLPHFVVGGVWNFREHVLLQRRIASLAHGVTRSAEAARRTLTLRAGHEAVGHLVGDLFR